MRRLKIHAIVAALLLAVSICAADMFLNRPGSLLTDRTTGALVKYLGARWSPRWKTFRFSAAALGPDRHRYELIASDFCVNEPKGLFSGCFSRLELRVVVSYSWHGPLLERVESFVALSDGARLDLSRLRPPNGVLAALLSTPVEALRLELSRFTVSSSSTAVYGALRADLTSEGRRPLSVSADVRIRGSSGERRLKAELTAETDLLKGAAPTYADVVGRADLGAHGRARASFRLHREASGYAVSGRAEVAVSSGPVRTIRLTACNGAGAASGAALACRYELVLAEAVPQNLGGMKAATGGVRLEARRDGEKIEAELKAEIDPIKDWYELAGDLAIRVSGRLDRPLKTAAISDELRATLKVPRFEDVVSLLRETKYSIPAPIHVLKGPLSLVLESRGDPRADRQTAHYAFSSDLAGPRQKLILRATGDLTVVGVGKPDRAYEHDGELILKEVALELPRLDIHRPPMVLLDKRIKTGDEKPAAAPAWKAFVVGPEVRPLPLRSRLVVRTEKPLLLFSNLVKEPVPANLDLIVSYPPAGVAGMVSVEKFDVTLFRRSATIDHLNVSLTAGSKIGGLEGLVRCHMPSSEIRVLLLGTTAKPRVELSSVPPMNSADIIALLIFGKRPDDLDLEQTSSVVNTETALESQAFGLSSLYVFGATPIEHVGYDSATKTATVKFRLPGGADLELGSDFDQNSELRLRKPLAPHWAIESDLTDEGQQSNGQQSSGQQSSIDTTFIEWFDRY